MNEVISCFRKNQNFVIVGHKDPDGDSLGSAMALALGLEQLGKGALVVSADAIAPSYQRLPHMERVQQAASLPSGFPVAVLIECNGIERTGLSGFQGRLLVNIDHHAKNPRFADVNWIDPNVAATGVMIHRLLRALDADITHDIAVHLYVAVLTDTGSFRYSNTDAAAFRLCAELLDYGVDAAAAASWVYEHVPAAKARMLGLALSGLELESEGRVAWMVIPHAVFCDYPGEPDTEGIVNHAQSVEGVDVSVLFKEIKPKRYRISLRSSARADVAAIAASFGGGGHPRAAGCLIEGSFESVHRRLLRVIEAKLAAPQKPS
ncbi:MAG: bifunctional oligoribonuclease/PAP phosphatase NrnA [Acidobacteriota bacterium]